MPAAQRPTVVLVDDDAALRTALIFSLELEGFAVLAFSSAEDMMAGPLPAPPACLVLDQNLAGMSGVEALQALRDRAVRMPAVLVTSHLPPHLRETVARLDGSVVEKPLLGDSLATQIRGALGL